MLTPAGKEPVSPAESDFVILPSGEEIDKDELDTEIQELAQKSLASNRPRKRTAAYAGAWTALSSIGGVGSTIGKTVSDTALWSLGYETEPTLESLSEEARSYHANQYEQGLAMIQAMAEGRSPDSISERVVTNLDLETNIADLNIYLQTALMAFKRIAEAREIPMTPESRRHLAQKLTTICEQFEKSPQASDENFKQIKDAVIESLNELLISNLDIISLLDSKEEGIEEMVRVIEDNATDDNIADLDDKNREAIINAVKEYVPIVSSEEVKRQTDIARGEITPRTLVKSYTFGDFEAEERLETLDPDTAVASDYLYQVGLDEDAKNIELRQGIRVSESKNYPEIAGKSVNLWRQSMQVGDKEEAVLFRSGVFSVHSFKSSSIRKLDDVLTKIAEMETDEEKSAAIKSLRWPKRMKPTLTDVESALSRRRHLGIAQALPKIVASLEESFKNREALENAIKTGKFLHAETSYLSDFDDERRMLHDMVYVMEMLSKHVKVYFADDPELLIYVNSDTDDISLNFPIPKDAPEGLTDQNFGLLSLMFSQGVNFKQAVSAFVNVSEQTLINQKALNELKEYAIQVYEGADESQKAPLREPLVRFLRHFTQGTENLETVDLEGTDLIADLIAALKGQLGIVCKSGKDRTGMAASRFIANKICKAHPEIGDKNMIKAELDKGLSYALTAYNSGGVKGYAIAGSGHTAVASMASNFAPDYSLVNKNAKT